MQMQRLRRCYDEEPICGFFVCLLVVILTIGIYVLLTIGFASVIYICGWAIDDKCPKSGSYYSSTCIIDGAILTFFVALAAAILTILIIGISYCCRRTNVNDVRETDRLILEMADLPEDEEFLDERNETAQLLVDGTEFVYDEE